MTTRYTTMLESILSDEVGEVGEAARNAARAFGLAIRDGAPGCGHDEGGAGAAETGTSRRDGCQGGPSRYRIERGVRDSDATLWLGETATSRAQATVMACLALGRPCLPISQEASYEPSQVAEWLRRHGVRTLYVAGDFEAEGPGMVDRLERFLGEVFLQLDPGRG
jgi:hypothetical protein